MGSFSFAWMRFDLQGCVIDIICTYSVKEPENAARFHETG